MTETKPQKTGPPRKIYPLLYYGHVYIDKPLFDMVHLFADWNRISLKSAVHQLLTFGLNYYAITQLRLEQARQANEKPPEPTKLYSLDAISNYLTRIYKKRKELPKIPGQEDRHPL